jgi:hypothetical protein
LKEHADSAHSFSGLGMRGKRPRRRATQQSDEVAPSHCRPEGLGRDIVTVKTGSLKGATDVRFGSKADICGATSHVRFAPNSDRESGFPQKVMSALPLKADMCSAARDVR